MIYNPQFQMSEFRNELKESQGTLLPGVVLLQFGQNNFSEK